jgi:hypothetical protein
MYVQNSDRKNNKYKERRLIINHVEQRIRKPVEYTYFPKHAKDKRMHENEKIFVMVLL